MEGMSQLTGLNKLQWFVCVLEKCAFCKCVTESDTENEITKHLNDVHGINPNFNEKGLDEFDQLSIILIVNCAGKIMVRNLDKMKTGRARRMPSADSC